MRRNIVRESSRKIEDSRQLLSIPIRVKRLPDRIGINGGHNIVIVDNGAHIGLCSLAAVRFDR